ncbi:MAG: helix-turn-helix domain-containing protein [Bacteroides sp.]|nr:helix-turn-helix domain-containing protein [Bacteroides sp.]
MENNQTTTKVNLDFISQRVDTDYMDGDIMLIDDLKKISMKGSLQMDMIVVVICTEGKLQVDVNGRTFLMRKDDVIVCPPNVYLDNYMLSPDFNSKIIGLSYTALQRMLHISKDIWNMMLHLQKNPVFHLEPDHLVLVDNYYSLIAFKLRQTDAVYQKEVMRALFQAVFYDLCSIIIPLMAKEKEHVYADMKQGDWLVKRFLEEVAGSQGKERSVSAYADRLCVTPKYLSTVCKASTGKTALEWIHEYTTDVIVQQLKYSDKTVKEIVDELCFPNISFFGKFVKARLGVSPTEYRRQLAEQK